MPRYAEPPLAQRRLDVPRGTLQAFACFASAAYPSTRTVWVYTPPGYDDHWHYSSVYFHDGGDYIRFGEAPALLDTLIADGVIAPCVAVFVDPSAEHGRVADYDLNPRYVRLICDELVPWVERRFAVAAERERRAVVGASFGGLISLLIGYERPASFGGVASQSGFVGRSNGVLLDRYTQLPALPLRFDLVVGTYETQVGPVDRGSLEANFLEANRALHAVLRGQDAAVHYAEAHEGHSWGLWRARLGEALAFLLPAQP